MTDSIIILKYSDNVYLTALYIKCNTHDIIEEIYNISKEIEWVHRSKSFDYSVAEIVSKLITIDKYSGNTKFLIERCINDYSVINRFIISLTEEAYEGQNKLSEFLTIQILESMSDEYIKTSGLNSRVENCIKLCDKVKLLQLDNIETDL